MNTYVIIPIAVLILSGVALELSNIAEETSKKTVTFASDANDAVDCAIKGIPISECSARLTQREYQFAQDLEEFRQLNEQLIRNVTENNSLHVTLPQGGAFKLEYEENTQIIGVAEVKKEEVVLQVLQLEKGLKRDMFELSYKDSLKIDLNVDGNYDALIRVTQIYEEDVELFVEVVRGEVVPLKVPLLLLLLFALIAVAIHFSNKSSHTKKS